MKQTKQFLRPLLMAIVMMVGMLVPQGAWAEDLEVDGETVTISSDASYDEIEVNNGGFLIINEGVTLTVTSSLYINDDNINGFGTVINYGTIIGDGSINMYGGVLANHGHIDLGGSSGHGTFTFYNTGTLGGLINLSHIGCDHDEYDNLGTVAAATCTHGAVTQYRCYTCYYMRLDETSGALPHSFDSHNGINICSSCGHTAYDEPANGDGSEDDPYQIANAGNLYWFADKVNNDYDSFKDANAVLTADIVVNDGTFAADGTFTATGASEPSTPIEWLIIGRFNVWPYGYGGTFDGQGHTISGLYANYSFSGLVGYSARECKIKNVGVINSYFDGTGVGGICGDADDNTEISNCYSNVICKGSYVGGILGLAASSDISIINCYSTASLINQSGIDIRAGGIAGQINGSTTNCYTSYGYVNGWSGTEPVNCEANVSLERFALGEIAYKLNGSKTDGTQAWYQKIGTDAAPVLVAAEGNTVYQCEVNNANFYVNENCTIPSLEIDNNEAFAAPVDVTATSVTFTRSIIKDGGKYSFIVPFDIPAEKASTLGKFYKFEKYENDVVYFTEETDVKANTAYFFDPAQSFDSFSLSNVQIKATTSLPDAKNPTEIGLYGTYKDIQVPEGAFGYLYQDGSFVQAEESDNTLPAFRAYLWLGSAPTSAKVNAIFGFFDEEVTGVKSATSECLDLNAPMYNLSGQRVSSPQKGEMYIMNGKKVMFK